MITTRKQEEQELVLLVKPWLPNAQVDYFEVSESCNCYSEWTTDRPCYWVTFKAPWGGSEEELSHLVRALESVVERYAKVHHRFRGCPCCQGEGYDNSSNADDVGIWVRVIPI